ncbi:MAG TPA: hypothetical protein VIS48_14960 [Candidatus Kryptonia bacterium]
MRYDKEKWLSKEDVDQYPYRNGMLDDLLSNHKLIGLSSSQLVSLLGPSDSNIVSKPDEVFYTIVVDYDLIDPSHVKNLVFTITQDTVRNFRVDEWKKGQLEQ